MDMTLPMTKAIAKASLADYAAVINDEHRAAFQSAQTAIEHARVAGEHLIKAKAALNHGEFGKWLAANVECSERTAQGYMRVATNWTQVESKSATVADLTLRGALDALSKPKLESPKTAPRANLPKSAEPADMPAPKPVAPVAPVEVEKLRAELAGELVQKHEVAAVAKVVVLPSLDDDSDAGSGVAPQRGPADALSRDDG